jgi:uncharacterized protein (TIGR02145 family)
MIMKKLFTLLAFVVTITAMPQSVAISDDGSVADGSAILDVKSTTKGFLLPRMTSAQRDVIVDPVAGLQIWCTDCGPTGAIEVYTGSEWSKAGVTSSQAAIIDNTSNTNTGDNATNTQYSAQAALITGLQEQIAELISDNSLVSRSVATGTQKWTTKNLDVATYRDGTPIPEVADPSAWAALKTGAWCYYDNDVYKGTTYGKLYNWYAVMGITVKEDATPTADQIAARKELAPAGWHVPSDEEWTTLTTFLDGNAGGKMKEMGDTHWWEPNVGATNSSGFTALPGGYRYNNGPFNDIGSYGYWWSSTEDVTTNAWFRYLNYYSNGDVYRDNGSKTFGFSVRCLRD